MLNIKQVNGALLLVLVFGSGCKTPPPSKQNQLGEQYKDGLILNHLQPVERINVQTAIQNGEAYRKQLHEVASYSPNLYSRNWSTYQAVYRWLEEGAPIEKLQEFGVQALQMSGNDQYGNVKFTGYYTPIISARYQASTEYRYPIYQYPNKRRGVRLPERADIHRGALQDRGLELAYSSSLIENFLMGVQGSAYIDFGHDQLNFFAYSGKNGHAYTSIGRILVEQGEIPQEKISLNAIRQWVTQQDEHRVVELLNNNRSFVFFQPKGNVPVRGASGVPLIAKASVAADPTLIPPGTTLLVEYPLLDDNGQFTGQYGLHLMVALDVGGAVKGHTFDIYKGIGNQAGEQAGYYKHYGRVWVLSTPNDTIGQKQLLNWG